jgi:GT2 family glycosyltransferase
MSNDLRIEDYAIVIPTHNPPIKLLIELLKSLLKNGVLNIYVVDSSINSIDMKVKNELLLNNQENISFAEKIHIIRVDNYGVAYSINRGVREAIKNGAKVITIMDDDTILRDFDPFSILSFFSKNVRRDKDLLILTNESTYIASKNFNREPKAWVEPGMTFHSELFERIQFREDFIMDQIDIEFSFKIRKNGGKLILYPGNVLTYLPIGREIERNINHLPTFRIYTLTRNTALVAMEFKSVKYMILGFFEIIFWAMKSVISGEKIRTVLNCIFHGFIDAISNNTGITLYLQKISNNRFSFNK